MNILHIVSTYLPAYRYGGPITTVHELNKALVRFGIKVTVYTTNVDGEHNMDVPLGIPVDIDGVKVFYFPSTYLRSWFYADDMRRALRDNIKNFDFVHITSVFLSASTLGAYYARKYNIPYIISPRGSLISNLIEKKSTIKKKIYLALIEKRNLAHAEGVHFTTEYEKEEYTKLNLPLKKAIIVVNSLAIEEWEKPVAEGLFRKKYGIASGTTVILFFGRINWKKGIDTLIPAMAEVVKKEQNTILVVAGGDDEGYGGTVRTMIRENKIEDRVIMTGMLQGEIKLSALKESDIFVLPSYSENFGMTVIEAMYSKMPVIITNRVGIAPEVKETGAGIVIEKNEKSLANAILMLLQNQHLRKKMGEQGKEMVQKKFSWPEVAKSFAKEYNDGIQKSKQV